MVTRGDELAERVLRGEAGAVESLDIFVDGRRAARDFAGVSDALDPLAAAAARGDERALAVLLGLVDNHGLARATIARFLHDRGEIDDAVQDTLFSVSRAIGRFEGRARFTTWLHPIAANAAKQVLRRQHRVARPTDEEAPALDPTLRTMSSFVATREHVMQAMAALPDAHREILEMRELHDLAYQEIADRLDIEVGTVKSRLNRAREQLAALLQRS